MSLICIEPMTITAAMVTTSAVDEALAAWSSVTTYGEGARILDPATTVIWESLAAGNTNNPPATSPTKWLRVGLSNRWRMFDQSVDSVTTLPGGGFWEITPSTVVTALHLENLVADSVRVRMIDPVYGTVYDQTRSTLPMPLSADWWSYWYGRRYAPTSAQFLDLPAYPAAKVRVDLTGASAALGACVLGPSVAIGRGVQWGFEIGGADFSTRDQDAWGNATLTPGAFSPTERATVVLERAHVAPVRQFLISQKGRAAVWIVWSEMGESTTVYGWIEDWRIVPTSPKRALLTVNFKGLT